MSPPVAHSSVYGYGFLPYEYISPAKGDNLSHYTQRETSMGMNALRSPVYPQFMVLVSLVASWAGVKVNPYLVSRSDYIST